MQSIERLNGENIKLINNNSTSVIQAVSGGDVYPMMYIRTMNPVMRVHVEWSGMMRNKGKMSSNTE